MFHPGQEQVFSFLCLFQIREVGDMLKCHLLLEMLDFECDRQAISTSSRFTSTRINLVDIVQYISKVLFLR